MSALNNSLLLGQEGGGGYAISRSLRFNSSDSAYLSRTPASAGNRKTWTWAGWVKRSALGAFKSIFGSYDGSTGSTYFSLIFTTSDTLRVEDISVNYRETTQVFRDASAWYHLVLSVDTTNGTANDRIRLYVNGSQVTAFNTTNNPSSSADLGINGTYQHGIGRPGAQSAYYQDGYLADIHFIDGQALGPTSFGEFSATTGVWMPKQYTGTYGTNGFKLSFSDNSTAAALGTDTSGNGNNWTPNNFSVFSTYSNAVAFDGSGDSFTAPSAASISGTGDFTVEFWILPRSFGSGYQVIYANDTASGISIGINSTGTIFYGKSLVSIEGTTSNTVTFNQWNHFALTRSSGTVKMFINGSQGFSGSFSFSYVSGVVRVGADGGGSALYLNGLVASLRTVSGTALYASAFTPPSVPLTAVSGTTLLTCQSSTLVDQSANTYTLTAVGDTHVVRSLVGGLVDGSDSLVDVPTNGAQTDTGVGGEVRGNYCTLNPLDTSGTTLSNGNLDAVSTGAGGISKGTFAVSSGKWYWEVTKNANNTSIGIALSTVAPTTAYVGSGQTWSYYSVNGYLYTNGTGSAYGATYANGDVVGIALDLDNDTLTFYKNGVSQGTAVTGLTGTYTPAVGNDQSGPSVSANFGQRAFAYTAPSGFKALCTANLPAPVVTKANEVMDVALYTGNGASRSITGFNFSPDLVWIKARSTGNSHRLFDVVRGAGAHLTSNGTDSELTTLLSLSSFNSDGFGLGNNTDGQTSVNINGTTYAAWCWDAGSSTVTNTQGSITSSVRANATAGFSIVSFTGPVTTSTVGHGLGVAPSMIILKNRDQGSAGYRWCVYHVSTGNTQALFLDGTNAAGANSAYWGNTTPTSTVFTVGTAIITGAEKMIAYCFAPVAGYANAFSYSGNGSSDGPMCYLGFRPRLILLKVTNTTGPWYLFDTARNTYNVMNNRLEANSSSAEASDRNVIDALSNGFKLRDVDAVWNQSGNTYVGFAWAESPFQYARAR